MTRRTARRAARWLVVAALAGLGALALLPAGVALAQQHGNPHDPNPPRGANPHATPAAGHGAPDAHGEGEHHGPGHINWLYGMFGEKEGVTEPDLFFRPKGMPAPFLANIINFSVVVGILVVKAGPMVRQGLIDRREDLLRDSEAAAKVLAEAQERYNEQKGRHDRLAEDKARILADYKEQGQRELERIDREGKERHERMVREAHQLIEQEGRAVRQRLMAEAIENATRGAEEVLKKQLNAADQERLAHEFLAQLGSLPMKRGEA